jgi:hypothetical protein
MSIPSRRNRLLASVILSVGCVASSRAAQEHVGRIQQPMMVKQEVFLVNSSGAPLRFELSCDKSNWDTHGLSANASKSYEVCRDVTHIFIRISTNGRPGVQYRLQGQQRYRLAWNKEKDEWDVFTVRK